MSDSLTIAILNAISRIGIDAVLEFLKAKSATVDDAIAALERAKSKSLADYIKEDADAAIPPPTVPDLPPIHGSMS